MTVSIVPITPEHIEGFNRAVDIVARERLYLAFLEGFPLESSRAFVLDGIARGHAQMVAVANGDVVGWCDVTPKSRAVHGHVGVLGMGVLPQFRGQGVGRQLIEATLAAAWATGLTRIELTVHGDNDRAIALYRKVGFETEGEQRDAVLIDGQYKSLLMMAIVDRTSRGRSVGT